MFGRKSFVPDGVPVLSPGAHRNPHKGACFMEMASFLAGERWSDNPKCTHPLLSLLGRLVNDEVDDEHRQQLTMLIPEVVGLNPSDRRAAPVIVRRAALAALPVVAEDVQNLMALALLNAEAMIAGDPTFDPATMSAQTRAAALETPGAYQWARAHLTKSGDQVKALDHRRASRVLELAVHGIGDSCSAGIDQRLIDLLVDTIAEVRSLHPAPAPAVVHERWRALVRTA